MIMSSVSKSLIQGMHEAVDYATNKNKKSAKSHAVHVPKEIDVKAIRSNLKMSRSEFSSHFGFNQRTLEKWEQGSRNPDRTARAYLTVIASIPKEVEKALNQ